MLFNDNKRYYIDRRLVERIAATRSASFQAYFAILRSDVDHEIEHLINAFTVNETYFNREEHQLRCMLDDVSELEFGSVFDALDVGIVVLDGQGCIVGWNDWIARASRHSEQSVLGKNLFDIFPNLRETRLPAALEESIQVGSSSILTHSLNTLLPLRDEAGQQLLHNIVVRPLAPGRATHCLLQVNDVTVSLTRERVLRERQNARYHAIVDTAPDAIITTGLDRTIQWLNGAAEHDTTTMSPRKTSRCPTTSATTSVTAVPLAFVSSLSALALRSSVTLGNSSAGRTATVSASDLACTRQGKPSQVWQRMQVLYAMFCSSSITAQGAGKG